MNSYCFLALVLFADVPDISHDGVISGVVVNRSRQDQPVGGAKVVLELKSGKEFAVLDKTETDSAGRFYFHKLLVSPHIQYKTGAQRHDIHYPGPRVVLTSDQKHVRARIVVRDVVHEPNPLVVRQHAILVESETARLRVTESMIIDNPTDSCYIGPQNTTDEDDPQTLQLSIPRDFLKVTFHEEFFGRAFAMKRERLVTSLPWEPGRRELTFTYVLSNDKKYRTWQRPLDLPTDNLYVRIATDAPDEVACMLDNELMTLRDGTSGLVFETVGASLRKGQVVRVEMGQLPISWMVYGRWAALIAVAVIIVAGLMYRTKRSKTSEPEPRTDSTPPASSKRNDKTTRRRRQRAHRKRRRAA